MKPESRHDIINRLRDYDACNDSDVDFAADMLEFFLDQFQNTSAHMNGQHRWRLRGSGWPMTHAIGATPEDAIRAILAEIAAERNRP